VPLRVVHSVLDQAGTQLDRAVMLDIKICSVGDGQVKAGLLRDRSPRPGDFGQFGHLLKGDFRGAVGIAKHEPVLTEGVNLPRRRRLVSRR
jgi:hypothetical protein